MSAIRWRSATTPLRNCWRSPTPGWTATASCREQRIWLRRSERSSLSHYDRASARSLGRGGRKILPRPERKLAVAFQIRTCAHVELAVFPDEEQRVLRHLLGALEQEF